MPGISTIAIGTMLILTATLKLYDFLFVPFQPDLLLLQRWQHLVLMKIEFVLGIWLLSGLAVYVSRWVGIIFFSAAAMASIYLVLIGQPSCGCFGSIKISPWISLTVDVVAVLVLLIVNRTGTQPVQSFVHKTLMPIGLGTMLILGVIIELFFLTVSDPERKLAQWRGDVVTVSPSVLDVGSGKVGESKLVVLRVHNNSNQPINIVGGTSSCACITLRDLPVTIQSGGYKEIGVIIKYVGLPGQFVRQFVLYTDHLSARVFYSSFRGTVQPASSVQ